MSQTPNQALLNNGINFVPTTHHTSYPFVSPLKASLAGRTIFITGASKGIGRRTALSFARAGASNLVLAARSSLADVVPEVAAAAAAAGHPAPTTLTLGLDIADEASVAAAAAAVAGRFGGLDVLVNNAGTGEPFVPLAASAPARWWRSYEVNVRGPYLLMRALLPLFAPAGLRTILNVASIGAHVMTAGSAYQSGKLALLRLTEFVAQEEAAKGIVAMAVHPGGVATELTEIMPEHMKPHLIDTPELPADTIVWLTGERREWLSGRYVSCNWDMEELLAKKDEIVEGDLLKVRMAVTGPH